MKTCTKCKIVKNIDEFYKGNGSTCKACHNKYTRKAARRFFELNIANQCDIKEKQCVSCKQIKPSKQFTKRRYSKDGLCSYCIECRKVLRATPTEKRKATEYVMKRYNNDIEYRLRVIIRNRIKDTAKNTNNFIPLKNLGCTAKELKEYIESLFYPNPQTNEMMSWDNYGYSTWHIHHIVSLHTFDLTDPEQFKKATHYTNLKPLWAEDHVKLHHA